MEKDSEDIVSQEKELEDEKLLTKAIRIGSLFQIMFYSIHNDYHRTPVFIMNAVEVYEKCKTLELVISFNESGICLCYSTMKSHCSGLAKYEVVSAQEKERNVALSSHFSPSIFTVADFDNFDHPDKNTLEGKASAHDTAVTVFQQKPDKLLQKQLKKEVALSNMMTLTKQPCQQLIEYTEAKDLNFQESFNVDKEVFLSEKNIQDHEQNEFIISCVWPQNLDSDVLSTWAGMRSLLSKEPLSLLQERYLPFIPHPVTEY